MLGSRKDLPHGNESVTKCLFVSIKAREKEYEEFLSDQDGQVCKEMSEEWQQYCEKKAQPCEPEISPMMRFKYRGKLLG